MFRSGGNSPTSVLNICGQHVVFHPIRFCSPQSHDSSTIKKYWSTGSTKTYNFNFQNKSILYPLRWNFRIFFARTTASQQYVSTSFWRNAWYRFWSCFVVCLVTGSLVLVSFGCWFCVFVLFRFSFGLFVYGCSFFSVCFGLLFSFLSFLRFRCRLYLFVCPFLFLVSLGLCRVCFGLCYFATIQK